MFERRGKTPVVAVQSFRSFGRRDSSVTIKLECDGKGTTRRTVLQPLSKQGIVSVDDGKNWTTYLPDNQDAMVQPSPTENVENPEQRIALIKANYKLTVGVPTQIAGRRALVIMAKPVYPDMPTRIYSLDNKSMFLLRYETEDERDEKQTWIDTKTAEFHWRDDVEIDTSPPSGEWKFRRWPAPRVLKDKASAKKSVGFTPLMPSTLPNGFVIGEIHLLDSGKDTLLGLRITDGLVTATIYQWNSAREPKDPMVSRHHALSNGKGVSFQVFGDLPKPVRDRISAVLAK